MDGGNRHEDLALAKRGGLAQSRQAAFIFKAGGVNQDQLQTLVAVPGLDEFE